MTSQSSGETAAPRAQRIGWAILVIATLYICYFSHLGVIGFVGPDEPRYAWIARDMAETGDWVTPRLYGKPWFEKPPLLYWGGAIFFKLIGEQHPEVAARLPSAISALLATLALAWLAWRTYGKECARWLLLLLPTSVGMIGFSHAAATDMPFAGMLTIAMVCAIVALQLVQSENVPVLPRTPWLALLLFGFFLGLAVLAKGPAAFILTGGAVFFWATFTKRWRDAFRLLHPAAIASFCLTALPWYILCARRNPDFFRIFIIEHNFKRYLTPQFQHLQPFWFYGVVLPVAFLPWTAAFIAAIILGLKKLRAFKQLRPITSLLLCWSAFCVVFFSISKSKLPGYILPAIPAAALLIARACEIAVRERRRSLFYSSIASSIGFALAAGFAGVAGRVLVSHSRANGMALIAAAVILFLFALASLFLWIATAKHHDSSDRSRAFARSGMVVPLLIAILLAGRLEHWFFPRDPSGKTVATEIIAQGAPPSRLAVKNMNRGMHYGMNFYLKQEISDWDSAHPIEGYLLSGARNCYGLANDAVSCDAPAVFLERSHYYLLRVKPSFNGSGGSREPKKEE
jgi:4-amino-4-deoxy-L-arabinose transferase-like glycosyltransferase